MYQHHSTSKRWNDYATFVEIWLKKNGHEIDEELLENILKAFSVKGPCDNTTPNNICHVCWRSIKNRLERGKYIYKKTKIIVTEWIPHSAQDCTTCTLYTKSKLGAVGGKKKKPKSSGRPRTLGMWNNIPVSNQDYQFLRDIDLSTLASIQNDKQLPYFAIQIDI